MDLSKTFTKRGIALVAAAGLAGFVGTRPLKPLVDEVELRVTGQRDPVRRIAAAEALTQGREYFRSPYESTVYRQRMRSLTSPLLANYNYSNTRSDPSLAPGQIVFGMYNRRMG